MMKYGLPDIPVSANNHLHLNAPRYNDVNKLCKWLNMPENIYGT